MDNIEIIMDNMVQKNDIVMAALRGRIILKSY